MYILELFYKDGSKDFVGPFDTRPKAIVYGVALKKIDGSTVSSFETWMITKPYI